MAQLALKALFYCFYLPCLLLHLHRLLLLCTCLCANAVRESLESCLGENKWDVGLVKGKEKQAWRAG